MPVGRPFPPGVSGNPKGSSAKQRRRQLLRGIIADLINEEVPEVLLTKMSAERRREVEGQVAGVAIAMRLLEQALDGEPGAALKATSQILGTEPQQLALSVAQEAQEPYILPSPERRAALERMLREGDREEAGRN